MTRDQNESSGRIRAILADLLKKRLADSIAEVDSALGQWRGGELSVFEAHGEILRHVGRAELVAEQVGHAKDDATPLLRHAFDLGLVERDEFVELAGCLPEDVEPTPSELPIATQLPPKHDVACELLADGPILVHIDARHSGVSVPSQFRADPRLVLRFGYQLTPPIVDFEIEDDHLAGTLTFGGVPHRCIVPWPAVYAVVGEADQQGMVWPDDVPSAVIGDFSGGEQAPRRRAASQSELDGTAAMPSADEVKRGAHLKLVK